MGKRSRPNQSSAHIYFVTHFSYLPAMSKRIDIFSPNSIRLIFSNITAIYKFQRKFLEALRRGIEQNQVAKVFLKMVIN